MRHEKITRSIIGASMKLIDHPRAPSPWEKPGHSEQPNKVRMDFWNGMNPETTSHPERSGASVTSRAESKDPANLPERSRKSAGSFDSILVAEAPSIALRMTRVFREVHGPRGAGSVTTAAQSARSPISFFTFRLGITLQPQRPPAA